MKLKCSKCGNKFFRTDRYGERTCLICGKLELSTIKVAMPFIPKQETVLSTGALNVRARENAARRKALKSSRDRVEVQYVTR